MSRAELRESVDIPAPSEVVWQELTDWERHHEWVPLTRVWATPPDASAVGGRLAGRTGVGPIGFMDTMVITDWQPPQRCEVLHTGRLVRGEAGFELEPRFPHGTRLTWWESLVLPGGPLGALAWQLVGPVARRALRYSLRQLRDLTPAA